MHSNYCSFPIAKILLWKQFGRVIYCTEEAILQKHCNISVFLYQGGSYQKKMGYEPIFSEECIWANNCLVRNLGLSSHVTFLTLFKYHGGCFTFATFVHDSENVPKFDIIKISILQDYNFCKGWRKLEITAEFH